MLIDHVDENVKQQLRALARAALETELRVLLIQLAGAFEEWKAGEIDSIELDRRLYAFEQGPRKALSELYDRASPEVLVARALARGLLSRDRIPSDVLGLLAGLVQTFEEGLVDF